MTRGRRHGGVINPFARIRELEAKVSDLQRDVIVAENWSQRNQDAFLCANKEREHAKAALSAILVRCDGIARPNGTTKVIARIATAGLVGDSIDEAGQRLSRT